MAANPARGQVNTENVFSPPFALENLVSIDRFNRPVLHRLLSFLPLSTTVFICSAIGRNRSIPDVYRVTQMRTNGVHRGESTGTGPAVLKV